MKKGKTLSCLILGTLAAAGILGGGTVFAEEPAVTQLAEVVVIGDRNKEREVLPGDFVYTKSQTGFLSGKNTLDVPFTQMNFTEKAMETFTESVKNPLKVSVK